MQSLFFWIFLPSFVMLLFMLIPHHPVTHHVDHALHGLTGAFEHLPMGHMHVHVHAGDQDLSPVNSRVILAFTTFFGGIGWLAESEGVPALVAVVIAGVIGWLVAKIFWKYMLLIGRRTGSSHIREFEPIGRQGRVTIGIRPPHIGEVCVDIRGEQVFLFAHYAGNEEIPKGFEVIVERPGPNNVYTVSPIIKLQQP